MLKLLFALSLLVVACTPLRNPYYHIHIVNPPYMEVYVVNNESNENYLVNGKSTGKDTFDIVLPDTLTGKFDAGIAVSEIVVDKNDQISGVNIVGMTLYDMEGKERMHYDKYCKQCRKINSTIPVDLSGYASVLKSSINGFTIKRKNDAMTDLRKAYIFVEFYKRGYEHIYIN